jgi:RNA 3'-terminal phosphate cyclase (ATP)
MLTLDGGRGEGGGQILRTALGLSLLTQTPFRISRIRAGREKPGLMRQHLTAVNAAAKLGDATLTGAEVGSKELTFSPMSVSGGAHTFAVGTAGSAMLVLQTVLPPLLLADEPSELVLEGGTHNPFAPTFDFLADVFAPLLRQMGAGLELKLIQPGFYPAGGGRVEVKITPVKKLQPLTLLQRGPLVSRVLVGAVAQLSGGIARREIDAAGDILGWADNERRILQYPASNGPGNALWATVKYDQVTEQFIALGERGVTAEQVGEDVAGQVQHYLETDAPVGEHLADQLLLPMALAKGGAFRTGEPSLHTTTQMETIKLFLGTNFKVVKESEKVWHISV